MCIRDSGRAVLHDQNHFLIVYLGRLNRKVDKGLLLRYSIAEQQALVDLPIEAPKVNDQKMILVVEDSSTTRKVISITLSRHGYRVVEAADGLEALSKISEERPDLIMLDVILPKMDGYKILSIIKGNKEFKEIPVIMLTSCLLYTSDA